MDLDIEFCFDKKSKRLLRISPMAKEEVVSVDEQKRKRESFTFTVCHGVDAWMEKVCLLVSFHSLGESR